MNNKSRLLLLPITTCITLLQSHAAHSDAMTAQAVLTAQGVLQAAQDAAKSAITGVITQMQGAVTSMTDTSAQKQIAAQGQIGDGLSQTQIDVYNQNVAFWMTPDVGGCTLAATKANLAVAAAQQELARAKVNAMVGSRVRGGAQAKKYLY